MCSATLVRKREMAAPRRVKLQTFDGGFDLDQLLTFLAGPTLFYRPDGPDGPTAR